MRLAPRFSNTLSSSSIFRAFSSLKNCIMMNTLKRKEYWFFCTAS